MTDGICPFAKWLPTRNYGPAIGELVGFCDHTMSGYKSTMDDTNWLNGSGISAHFGIGVDGSVSQYVNIFQTAWAQGRLGPNVIWKPYQTMVRETGGSNPNAWLISTEHEDKTVSNYVWSEAMYEADLRVKRWCIEEVKRVTGKDLLRFGIDSLTGHYMFDGVNRANCPGSGWPRERLYADLTSKPPSEEDDMITQHDGWGLEDLSLAPLDRRRINAREVFGVPATASRIHVEFLSKAGYAVIENGDGRQAGRVGWSRRRDNAEDGVADGYAHCDVWLAPDGTFSMYAEDPAPDGAPSFYRAHCTAYA